MGPGLTSGSALAHSWFRAASTWRRGRSTSIDSLQQRRGGSSRWGDLRTSHTAGRGLMPVDDGCQWKCSSVANPALATRSARAAGVEPTQREKANSRIALPSAGWAASPCSSAGGDRVFYFGAPDKMVGTPDGDMTTWRLDQTTGAWKRGVRLIDEILRSTHPEISSLTRERFVQRIEAVRGFYLARARARRPRGSGGVCLRSTCRLRPWCAGSSPSTSTATETERPPVGSTAMASRGRRRGGPTGTGTGCRRLAGQHGARDPRQLPVHRVRGVRSVDA
jgi:hypothetical protein